MIQEFTKVRLKTGEIAHIVEVLQQGVAYVAEIVRKNGEFTVSVEQVLHEEIESVFTEVETALAQGVQMT